MEYFNDPLNQQRFMRRLAPRISDDDHWIWNSTVFKRNNGKLLIPWLKVKIMVGEQRQVYARRFAMEMQYGKPVAQGMNVVNVCGEHLCVRPHEKHNVSVSSTSWNSYHDKRAYQIRHGILVQENETEFAELPNGGVEVKRGGRHRVLSEEEFMKG